MSWAVTSRCWWWPRSRVNLGVALTALPLAAVLASCSMVDSTQLGDLTLDVTCRDDAGAYFLSKGVVSVDVSVENGDTVLQEVSVHAVPDRRHGYCLNFRSSPLHDERLTVRKTKGLLQEISSFAEDQTPNALSTLVDQVFKDLPGEALAKSRVAAGEFQQPFKADFDPFDATETALLNDELNDLGFCMMLREADWVIDLGRFDPGAYCDNPLTFLAKRGGAKLTPMAIRERAILASQTFRETPGAGVVDSSRGILYRPRLTYTLKVYVKSNIDAQYISPMHPGGVRWNLRKQKTIPLENKSPILAIGVDRTFFAKRKTVLRFNAGALVDVDIEKNSELVGFIKIPLTIADAIIKVPTKILQLRVNNTKNRAELIKAQTELIKLEHGRQKLASDLAKEQQARAVTAAAASGLVATGGSLVFGRSLARSLSLSPPSDPYTYASEAQCQRSECGANGAPSAACKSRCQCIFTQCIPNGIGQGACDSFCVAGE